MPCRPRHRSSSPRVTAAACCALGLSPDGLRACLVTAGAGRLLLSLSLSVIRARLRTVDRLILLPPHRGQLLPRGLRFLLSVSLRLPRLGQLPFGLPGSEARLPPIGLGLLGAGPKLRPGLFGRRDLRLQPGLVRARRLAGLRHLLLRRPAHPVQLRPGRLSRLPRLARIGLGLLGAGPKLRPGFFGCRDLRLQPGLVRARRLAGLRHLLFRRPAHPVQLRPGRLSRLPRLARIGLGLLGAGPKLRPGLFGRRDLRLQPGLIRARRLAGLRHLLLRRPAHPVQLRPSRLSRLPRPRRVLPGLAGPGLSPGRAGLRTGYGLVPLPPHRSQLLPRGPRLLLSGGLRLPRPGQPRLGLRRGLPRLARIGLGLLGAGPKLRPGFFGCRDLRLQPGLVRARRLAGLRHLLFRRPAHPIQLRLSRLPRPRRVLPGLAGPGLSPGRPGLRAGYGLVPLLLHRSQLLPRGPRLLLSGGLRLPRPGQPRLSLGLRRRRLPRPGQPCRSLRRRLPRIPRIGLGPLGAGLKPSPGLPSRRDLLFRRPAHPFQLRLSRLPRPRRVLPGLAGPGLSPGRPGLRAGYGLVPLLLHRSQLLPRGPRLLLSGGLRLPRPGQPRLSLRRCSTRLPRISLGPLAAPPERGPRPSRVPRIG